MTTKIERDAWWFFISDGEIVLQPQGEFIPYGNLHDLPISNELVKNKIKLGSFQSSPCYLVMLADKQDVGMGEYVGLRSILGKVSDELFDMAGRALQVAHFYKTHQYCGQCATPMRAIKWENAMQCDSCGHRAYPRVSPCIIVAIRKENKILLALHKRHDTENPIFTVLAGFTEAGETLEQCVEREVFEESSIRIKNIEYVKSQPWPFPHSLMMGFVADYYSGEIKVDPHELISADWYDLNDLPNIPNIGTVARKLINKVIDDASQIKS
ncbi:MAG TPA: NAD(+) diphosphatase [Psychromonas hadalis]|nr:NAD(+) diphosphatase [Psychromonas hadalis]